MDKLKEILDSGFFLKNSVYASLLLGAALPVVGIFLVLGRRTALALALPQVSTAGVALTAWIGVTFQIKALQEQAHQETSFFIAVLVGATLLMVVTLALLRILQRDDGSPEEADTAALYVAGAALALALAASDKLTELGILGTLKGEILVPSESLLHSTVLGLGLVLLVLFVFRRPLEMVLYNSEMAYGSGLSVKFYGGLTLALVCLTVTLGSLCGGPFLTIALLVVPPVTVLPFVNKMPSLYFGSAVIGALACFWGFYASYVLEDWNLPVSAAQILILALIWLVGAGVRLARMLFLKRKWATIPRQ